ncbi:TIR domain-containing protein [Methylobacterium sp. J-092]|uniref:TIR domain-containing protein n=1 Tax=Methylobacterium sp. J-092 TaxID=2836667 RepID=UPI001FB8D8CF|nr:TIR domain-containing protein [Methylobacterium sp. J-092]MCJ2009528.1 nucleotide-binding protein [Methylobacterium sp. J-092]
MTVDDMENVAGPEKVCEILDRYLEASRLPTSELLKTVMVYIGHGRSRLWKDLKDHLRDHHGIEVIAYETGARAGYTIQEVLADMASSATLALLVHTGENIDRDGLAHARENVVHETGLFQGRLGFKRAIVILEDDTSEFSNIVGLQQIRFSKGNIREIFGDVLAVIKREFVSNA